MKIDAVSTQQAVTQTQDLEKKKQVEKEEVSFWSSNWTAGNFVREKIGWDGLADWLEDKDKVCTDGEDDGKLSFGETMKSFGKGLLGLVKGVMNHPIATAVSIGAGAAAVALTGGAILPVLVAAGFTMGAGMIGVGAYKAISADTDAEAKQAWETIGTGTFTVGASALTAKTALKQAHKAGVETIEYADDMDSMTALVKSFKSVPEALKVSKGNAMTNITGVLHPNSIATITDTKNYLSKDGQTLRQKLIQAGTKYKGANGVVTVDSESVLLVDKSGNLSHISYNDLLSQHGITPRQVKGIPAQDVVDIIFKNTNIENFLTQHANSKHMDAIKSGAALFRRELQGGNNAAIGADLLKQRGVDLVYGSNNYNGPDPLVGYKVNGNLYELPDLQVNKGTYYSAFSEHVLNQIETQSFPAVANEEALIAKYSVVDYLYTR